METLVPVRSRDEMRKELGGEGVGQEKVGAGLLELTEACIGFSAKDPGTGDVIERIVDRRSMGGFPLTILVHNKTLVTDLLSKRG